MNPAMIDRYSRQILFPGIGEEGQKKLNGSSVIIIGCGALGTVIANSLVRAGVGNIRIVDRDFIEYHNLQRQVLFNEDDIRDMLPKAVAAERHLKKINSSINIEGIVADINYTNIEKFIGGMDLILDGLDNFETRYLINEAALKHGIPWIYGGAVSSYGMTMNIIPSKTPCFRCLAAGPPSDGLSLTCDTAGIVNSVPFIIGSLQAAEAMKMIVGAEVDLNKGLLVIDVWQGIFDHLEVHSRDDCPACNGKYEFLDGKSGIKTTSLCGQGAVQVLNPRIKKVSFKELSGRLSPLGEVSHNEYMLRFQIDDKEMIVFPDGRAIVKDTTDESLARGLYAKYIGA
jgi:adenylyltransferase/sulfurtransferase